MTVFGDYARYYDLLYRDKDYLREAQFVHQLLQRHGVKPRSILELGCGTGAHAQLLATDGYHVHGVDVSDTMLQQARDRQARLSPEAAARLSFSLGNIQEIRLDRAFDAVISLFHVVSYQTTNEALKATFATANAHLKSGGIFIFDVWYGPAVLRNSPTVRVKRLEDQDTLITRIAEPEMFPNRNEVEVNYQVFIKDKNSGTVAELNETHQMRYLFMPEIEQLLEDSQMELVDCREWMSDREAGFDTWGTYFIGKVK